MERKITSFIAEAIKHAEKHTIPASYNTSHTKSADDLIYEAALRKVNEQQNVQGHDDSVPNSDTSDKGLFGNRQVEFVQDVYFLSKNLKGDKSQPIGLLTQSDLTNYVAFRKGDRLTFKYKSGSAGSCKYDAMRNGQEGYKNEFDWSDGLVQELIDEGACKLHD